MPIRNTRELVGFWFGDELASRILEFDLTIGTSVTRVLKGNGSRIWVVLSNFGTVAIALSTNPAVTATTGILLAPSGFLAFNWQSDHEFMTQELFGIASGAGNALHVAEMVLIG